jgi:WD40 repeat protein
MDLNLDDLEIIGSDHEVDEKEMSSMIQDVTMDDGDVELDTDDFEELPVAGFTEHHDSVFCVCIHPNDANIMASGGGDDKAFIWNCESKKDGKLNDCVAFARLEGHSDSIVDIAFNFDGSLLATAGMDGIVKIWDVSSGVLKRDLVGPGAEIEWIHWHPKGNVILAGSADTTTWMWNSDSGKCMGVFSGHIAEVRCGKFDQEGKIVVTGGGDGTAFVWNPKTGESKFHFKGLGFHDGAPITVLDVYTPLLATGSEDGSVRLSQTKTGKVLGEIFKFEEAVEAVQFSPKGKWIAAADMSGKIKVYDVSVSKVRLNLDAAHEDGITRLRWLPSLNSAEESSLLLSASVDHGMKIWDIRSGTCIKDWSGVHQSGVLDVDVTLNSNNQYRIVSAGDDGIALVFKFNPNVRD